MARVRMLKPSFFTNEDLGACSPLTRLFFEGLWCWADRDGRLEDRPRRLAVEILPYDRDADGEAMLAELATRGFIARYAVGPVRVIQVLAFDRHQNPHPREAKSKLPPFPGIDEATPRTDLGNALPVAETLQGQEEPGGLSDSRTLGLPDSQSLCDALRAPAEGTPLPGAPPLALVSPPLRPKKPPPDARHHPVRLMLASVYAEKRGGQDLPWGVAHGTQLSNLLKTVPAASLEEFERRWRYALGLSRYPGCADALVFFKRWADLVPGGAPLNGKPRVIADIGTFLPGDEF